MLDRSLDNTWGMSLHIPSLFKRPNLLNQMTWLLVKFADFQYKHLFAAAMLSRADTALASRLKHGAPFSLWMYSILLRPGASSGLMCCPGQLLISRYKYISQSFLSQILKSLITLLTTIRLPIVLNKASNKLQEWHSLSASFYRLCHQHALSGQIWWWPI